MRRPLILIAAASLAAGTLTFVGYQSRVLADDYGGSNAGYSGKTDAGAAAAATLPQGITAAPADQTDTTGIRQTLTTSADYVTSSNWNGLDNCFSSIDRERINFSNVNHQDFDKTLAQFKQDWKAKYNQDFNLAGKEQVVFGPDWRGFEIVQGEVSNPAMLSNWPVEPGKTEGMHEGTHEHMKGQERTGASSEQGMHASAAGPGQPSVDITATNAGNTGNVETKTNVGGRTARQLDRGTAVAVVTFPAQPNASETTVSLVREGGEANTPSPWKIDIPDSIGSQKLVDNLNTHLSEVDRMKNQWPDDVNQGYRFVSQHLYMAMYDTGAAGGMRTGGMEDSNNVPGAQKLPSHSEK